MFKITFTVTLEFFETVLVSKFMFDADDICNNY